MLEPGVPLLRRYLNFLKSLLCRAAAASGTGLAAASPDDYADFVGALFGGGADEDPSRPVSVPA